MNGVEPAYLFDTNAVIAWTAGDSDLIRLVASEIFVVSAVVIGELYHGAFKSQRIAENLARVEKLIATVDVLSTKASTGRWYGKIRTELQIKGRPIPENDIWIAACALENQLPLVTRDAHFAGIADLRLVRW